MDGIRGWIEAEGQGHWFFVAFPLVLLCLFISFKGRRVRFLIPSLIISIVIINPIFYKYWDKLGLYAYWRILWIVPVVPVVAGLVPSLTERIQKTWVKSIVMAAGVGLIVFGGTFIYNGAGGSFVEAANAAKLPDYVVQIADRLLELEERPRVIAQDPIGVYLRQYTGEVDTLFGRDMQGHITTPSEKAVKMYKSLNSEEWGTVCRMMLDEGYEYLVLQDEIIPDGFSEIKKIGDYSLYSPVGTPRIIRERNGLDLITKESYFNDEGDPLTQRAGHVAIIQEWKGDELYSRTYLGVDGKPINRIDGYSKVVWSKDGGTKTLKFFSAAGEELKTEGINLVKDHSFDDEGWSEWISPSLNTQNTTLYISTIVLGDREVGDFYSCQLEIEFIGVTAGEGNSFLFQTQGPVDGKWEVGNIWNPDLVCLTVPPSDGMQSYTSTIQINEERTKASEFSIGFRLDNWASGKFRIRGLKIEKGKEATEWSPGI